ncbi:hypothetical protein HNQ91_002951 [Filimonas zeae]|uniref:SWIM-type domain-containing protein n=1 Tax=Filimonas zeae TaxID=1737353 RepID=A0A917MWF0_9BACT|nr:hypothetical protein [Filimonas zeae]MDR6339886.1 hypothetical protein [Filimonas zeae]GGH70136.1 hypothetical protein GCM10011379_28110 [Filimonas zeae]
MKTNKDDLRNTGYAYTIPLGRAGRLHADSLKKHIDSETFHYKQWPVTFVSPVKINQYKAEYTNTSGALSYTLAISVSNNEVHVICDCDRKVEMLCHHAYGALKYLITTGGEEYFLELGKILQTKKDTP